MKVLALLTMLWLELSYAFQSCCRTRSGRSSGRWSLERASTLTPLNTIQKGHHYVSTTSNLMMVAKPRSGDFWKANMEKSCWRPTINDVERISWGKPAKKKGTGSRGVPHRLNEEERFLFDQARRKGFLEIAGSGWRSQRREAPLLNSYRSLCDARGQASIILHKGNMGLDELVVDISPLRTPKDFDQISMHCVEQFPSGQIVFQGRNMEESTRLDEDADDDNSLSTEQEEARITLTEGNDESSEDESWYTRPIYQLPPYCIAWEMPRSDAKELGKHFAELFQTKEGKIASSKKPKGVKPGKGRRHGGYGIG